MEKEKEQTEFEETDMTSFEKCSFSMNTDYDDEKLEQFFADKVQQIDCNDADEGESSYRNSKLLSHLQYYLRQNATLIKKISYQANTASTDFELFKKWVYQDLKKHQFQLREAGKSLFFKSSLFSIDNEVDEVSHEKKAEINDSDMIVMTFSRHCDKSLIEEFVKLLHNDHPLINVQESKHDFNEYSENALYLTPKIGFIESFSEFSKDKSNIEIIKNIDYFQTSSLQKQSLLYEVLINWKYNLSKSSLKISNDHTPSSSSSTSTSNENDNNYPLLSKYLNNDCNIIETFYENCFLLQFFPIHDEKKLSKLKNQCFFQLWRFGALENVCEYFGVKIAIYFYFIVFYTKWLSFPMFFGIFVLYFRTLLDILHYFISKFFISDFYFSQSFFIFSEDTLNDTFLFTFTIFNMFWSTIMLQKWTENCCMFVQKCNKFLPLKCSSNLYVSMIGLCLCLTFIIMFQVFHFQVWIDVQLIQERGFPGWIRFVPKVMLAVIISISNYIYHFIAVIFNHREEHSEPEIRENSLILKLVLYQFLNNFLPLFYIAFYLGNIEKLKEQLAAQLITRQIIGNFNEAILPIFRELYRIASRKFRDTVVTGDEQSQKRISKPELESCMCRYESTFDDYLELVVQFGYVMLFAPVFPLAAACALLNNLLEIHSDAFKLFFVYQRPFAAGRNHGIDQWNSVLYWLSVAAIANNCALMVVNGQIQRVFGFVEDYKVLLTSVAIEHSLLIMKWLIPSLI